MPLFNVQITARSALAFPIRKPGTQFRPSLPYVPGAAIYGALGMWMGEQGTFDSELFREIRCCNAYPSHPGDPWVRPLPATAIQRKAADEDEQPHDSLVARVCWERQQPAALIYAPTDDEGRPWEAAGPKFYTLKGGKIATRTVTQRTLTRVSINRRRGTAGDQRLYSLLAINEVTDKQPTQFRGSLVVPNNALEQVENALGAIKHIGGRQTTGLGAIELSLAEARESTESSIQKRVQDLTKCFQKQVALYEDLGGSGWTDEHGNEQTITDETIFTVNLLSDTILLEHGWIPTNELSAAMLEALTGIKARLLRAFTTTSIVGGWNVSWQRPKPTNVAVNMGGVFVFQAEHTLEQKDYQALERLQLDGIGERRAEGYGQARICDNFHLM
ncbi:MAG: CRISPR-associated RAMP protein Csx10 [Chloroflexales bacterium]|nr:CRISPR-associated RAMP protein Csx10 [Chloroflexales bacterium]